mgnify:CR=1 FL=1
MWSVFIMFCTVQMGCHNLTADPKIEYRTYDQCIVDSKAKEVEIVKKMIQLHLTLVGALSTCVKDGPPEIHI